MVRYYSIRVLLRRRKPRLMLYLVLEGRVNEMAMDLFSADNSGLWVGEVVEGEMDGKSDSFVTIRRISQTAGGGNDFHPPPGMRQTFPIFLFLSSWNDFCSLSLFFLFLAEFEVGVFQINISESYLSLQLWGICQTELFLFNMLVHLSYLLDMFYNGLAYHGIVYRFITSDLL